MFNLSSYEVTLAGSRSRHRTTRCLVVHRVMVLDNGSIKELDTPDALLKNKEGIFYGMAKDTGLV